MVQSVRAAIANDLDTPNALAVIDNWAYQTLAGIGDDYQAGETIATLLDARFGIVLNYANSNIEQIG